MLDGDNTIEKVNDELDSYTSMAKNAIIKQNKVIIGRPKDNEYQAFDMVLSYEYGTFYLNIHDGTKFIRFKEDK